MASFEEEFIEEMRRTYNPNRLNGSRYTGLGEDNVLQKGRVAGLVHEGEQVVEAEMVDEAGGPARIRKEIERMADENSRLPGYQEGTGSETVISNRLNPIGDISIQNTPQQIISQGPKESKGPISLPNTDYIGDPRFGEKGPTETFARLNLSGPQITDEGLPQKPKVNEFGETLGPDGKPIGYETPITPQAPQVARTALEYKPPEEEPPEDTRTEDDIQRVRDIAMGESEAARIAREREMQELSAKHEAERQNLNQRMAQEGASQEEINSAMAQLGVKQRSESEQARTGLAAAEAERAEAAAVTTAQLQMSKEDMDARQKYQDELLKIDWKRLALDEKYAGEQIRQFNEMLKLDWAQYNLSDEQFRDISARAWKQIEVQAEQYGMDYALKSLAVNAEIQMPLMNAALQSGDFAAATAIASKFGVNLDFSKAENAFQQAEIGQGLANLVADIANIPDAMTMDPQELIDNEFIKDDLERMWTNMNPGEKAKGPAYEKWAMDTVKNLVLSQDPYYVFTNQLTEESVQGFAPILGWTDNSTFNGLGGTDGLRFAVQAFLSTGGMSYDPETGAWSIDPTAIERTMNSITTELGETVSTTHKEEERIGTAPSPTAQTSVTEGGRVIAPEKPKPAETREIRSAPGIADVLTAEDAITEIYANLNNLKTNAPSDFVRGIVGLTENREQLFTDSTKNAVNFNEYPSTLRDNLDSKIENMLFEMFPDDKYPEMGHRTNISGYVINDMQMIIDAAYDLGIMANLVDAGYSVKDAYRLTASLIGKNNLDVAIKKMTRNKNIPEGLTYEE